MIEESYGSLRLRPAPQPPVARNRTVDYCALSSWERLNVDGYHRGSVAFQQLPLRAQVFVRRHVQVIG